jgi:hypothetical protein
VKTNNGRTVPAYSTESYRAFAYTVADAYIRRESDRVFRNFQKSIDKQLARLIVNAEQKPS